MLTNTASISHMWLLQAPEMWLVRTDMHSKYKIDTWFERLSTKKGCKMSH